MRRHSKTIFAILPVLFLGAHAALLLGGGTLALHGSYVGLIAAPLLAAIACIVRGRRDGREGWTAFGLALLCWTGGMVASILAAIDVQGIGEDRISMLLYVLYGVPLIFALASPEEDGWTVRAVDAVMAAALGYLFHVYVTRFTAAFESPEENLAALQLMFDIENVYIALFALIRLRACRMERRAFFQAVAAYAVTYAWIAGYINHFHAATALGNWPDLLGDIPFLIAAFLATRPEAATRSGEAPASPAFTRLVRAGSALLIPLTLLTVSVLLVTFDPIVAMAGCIAASVGYGLRTVLVQLRNYEDQDQLAQLSRIDGLTGIPNRRCFDDELHKEWARRNRGSKQLGLLMIDIDHFKQLNDHYGHAVGDDCLRAVARALSGCARKDCDLVARYGGEEFAVILPDTDCEGVLVLAERMRAVVEALALSSPAPLGIVTASVGVGCAEAWEEDLAAFVAGADRALYEAKNAGRNRVALNRPTVRIVPTGKPRADGQAA